MLLNFQAFWQSDFCYLLILQVKKIRFFPFVRQHYDTGRSTTKPIKWYICRAKKEGVACASAQSETFFTGRLKDCKRPKATLCQERRLNSLGICPGWSETLVDGYVIFLVLSCSGFYKNTGLPKDFWLAVRENMKPPAPKGNILSAMALDCQTHLHSIVPFTWADHE